MVGYVGRYEVSSYGQVRSLLTNKLLKPTKQSGGYLALCVQTAEGKQRCELLHRMVLRSFSGEPPAGHECAHLDGIKANCRLGNLQWVTHKVNSAHRKVHRSENTPCGEGSGHAKLTAADVLRIRESSLFGARVQDLADMFGVTHGAISGIRCGKTWKHLMRSAA